MSNLTDWQDILGTLAGSVIIAAASVWTVFLLRNLYRTPRVPPRLPAYLRFLRKLPQHAETLNRMHFLLEPTTHHTLCTSIDPIADWYRRHGYCEVSLLCWMEAQQTATETHP